MKLNSQVDTQLSAEDCFYISDRYNKLLPYPIHCHADYELNFTEHGAGARRIVGDSMETLGDYDLVLITGQDLEHVWERYQCTSTDVREITIHFSSDLFDGAFTRKTHFRSILSMLDFDTHMFLSGMPQKKTMKHPPLFPRQAVISS